MTTRPPSPTDAELEILGVLWRRGPSTVRDVFTELEHRGTGYTTILKLMQIMAEKGLLLRDERTKSHVYRAVFREEPTQRRLVRDFIDKTFDGSASRLVLSALSAKPATKNELDEIRALLDEIERRGK
ncbi:MAG TPA: BlaI/MecI/CopY family transcriptional regulator [Polyangiaceae bacterium]|jgi:predicted transcriptional regulator